MVYAICSVPIVFKYGDSFSISFNCNEKGVPIGLSTYNYTESKYLRAINKDLAFLVAAIDNGGFEINGIEHNFNSDEVNNSEFDVVMERKRIKYLEKVVKLFDMLGISEDIVIADISVEGWRNIDRLITALINNKPVKNLKEDLPLLSYIDIGKYRIATITYPVENEPGTYQLYDFFEHDFKVWVDDEDGNKQPVSQYAILKPEDYLQASNIKYEKLLPSYQIINSKTVRQRANWSLLNILKAYDMSDPKKPILLSIANDFADWLYSEDNDYISTLNKIQVQKRIGDLTPEEIKILYGITVDAEASEPVLVGAYLLLDDQNSADTHFQNMPSELQDEFREYPIYSRFFENIDSV